MGIGERIRQAREQAGLTQTELGERVGVSRSAVAQWESSATQAFPTHRNTERLVAALKVNFEWLLTGRGPMRERLAEEAAGYGPPPPESSEELQRLHAILARWPRERRLALLKVLDDGV